MFYADPAWSRGTIRQAHVELIRNVCIGICGSVWAHREGTPPPWAHRTPTVLRPAEAIRTVIDTARLKPGANRFQTILAVVST